MKTMLRTIFTVLLLGFCSCQKDEIAPESTTEDSDQKTTALTYDFKPNKKVLKATEWSDRADLSKRYGHTSNTFDNKIWIIGGKDDGDIPTGDVLYSANGINWNTATAAAKFPARWAHASTVFEGRMWVVGGLRYDPEDHDEQWDPEHDHSVQDDEYSELNDVWSSTDGIHWNLVTPDADFSPRAHHTLTSFDGALWLIGGTSKDQSYAICCGYKDVWRSADGANWELVTDNAPFNLRLGHTVTTFKNKLILLGGDVKNGYGDLWHSDDGEHWNKLAESLPFEPRFGHTLTSDGDKLWLIGGSGKGKYANNDVWFSSNGSLWVEAGTTKAFPERKSHTTVFFGNRLWVINGQGFSPYKNKYFALSDIWSLEEPGCCEIDDITLKK